MLRWANRPDAVFHAVVIEALTYTLDWLALDEQTGERKTKGRRLAARTADQHYRGVMPRTAKLFKRGEAVGLIKRLLEAHQNRALLYQLTDYHWLVLYEVLKYFIDANEGRDDATKVGPYRVGRFDFGDILDRYFWDLDFITDEIAAAPEYVKRQLGVSRETWGVVSGLRPHPDELAITPVRDEGTGPFEPTPGPKTRRLDAYPPENLSAKWYYGEL
jgi:hypothetical protein